MALHSPRKLSYIVGLALAAVVAMPAQAVYAAPSKAELQKQLDALQKQEDQLGGQYLQTQNDLKQAKAKLTVAQGAAQGEQANYEKLRSQLAQLAAAAYKSGDMNDVSAFLSANDPQHLLDQVAVISQLSKDRSSAASQLLLSAQRLQLDNGNAQAAYDAAASKNADLKKQKADLDKKIAQAKKLLAKLGGGSSGSSGGGGGITYSGPASGSARTALQYAASKIGDPYVWGATGPNSFDCSGLTQASWGAAGVSLDRTAAAQYSQMKDEGHLVSAANRQPGDLIFFSGLGHVAMVYDGTRLIEAPHSGATVHLASMSARSDIIAYGRP